MLFHIISSILASKALAFTFEQMNRQTNIQIPSVFYKTLSPLGPQLKNRIWNECKEHGDVSVKLHKEAYEMEQQKSTGATKIIRCKG